MLAMLETLKENPDGFPLAHEARRLKLDLRELYYGSGRRKTHRVLFVIEGSLVKVLAVRHFAQRDVTLDALGR